MNRRDLLFCLAAAAGLSGCAQRAPSWVREGSARYGKPRALPPPMLDGAVSLERALALRRSIREFRQDPLPVATVGQLLWAGQGVTSADEKRTAPSAGALYQLYVVTPSQVCTTCRMATASRCVPRLTCAQSSGRRRSVSTTSPLHRSLWSSQRSKTEPDASTDPAPTPSWNGRRATPHRTSCSPRPHSS